MTLHKWRTTCNPDEFRRTIPKELLESIDLLLPSPLASLNWDISKDTLLTDVPEVDSNEKDTLHHTPQKSRTFYSSYHNGQSHTTRRLEMERHLGLKCSRCPSYQMEFLDETTASHLQHTDTRTIKKYHSKATFTSLHVFSDTSNLVYDAVVYFRTVHKDSSVSLPSHTPSQRVTPLKTTTTPRLELSVALLLSKIMCYLQKIYGIQEVYTWSNSEIVLSRLRRSPVAWKTCVAHQVAAIQNSVPSSK